jgi:hypothetical protein
MKNSVSLVTEAYNLAEGQSEAAFLRAVEAITKMAEHTKSVEILVMDPSEKNIAANILKRHFPQVKSLHVPGQSCEPPRFYARLPLEHRVATVKKDLCVTECIPEEPNRTVRGFSGSFFVAGQEKAASN